MGGKATPARCLVTGGAGFIGSHLVQALVEAGRPVRVLDNLSSGSLANLFEVADRIEFVRGDVTDAEDCRRACDGVGVVFHHAARVSVAESVLNPVATHEVNALGTLRLLWAAREAGVTRVVYAGSASAYGDCADLPVRESAPAQPLSPYAVAKHVGELYCRVFNDLYGLETVVLRYFNVFGPRQDPSSPYSGVIAQFAARLAKGEDLTIYGDGLQTRDFVPVENVVAANLAAAESPQAAGKVMNIGCARAMTINELAETMAALCGASIAVRHGEARAGDIRHSVACIDEAQQCLGYRVGVTPEEGLRRTMAWYLGR
jgi:nucleoside-diphosphate-sugar epimerase